MNTSLKDKVAIITGAAQGMVKAVAEKFAKEGAILILIDIKETKLLDFSNLLTNNGVSNEVQICDISNPNQVQRVVISILKIYGKIDILINCAGILFPSRFHKISTEEWNKVISVNLNGVFYFMREVYPHMKEQRSGSIINFSSTAGLTVSTIGGAHYTASKHAVIGLTKAVAKEGGPFGVRVNAVCPGLIDTEMVRDTIPNEQIESFADSFPIGRMGNPEEIAELVLFLATNKSSYITGASINVSGGDLLI